MQIHSFHFQLSHLQAARRNGCGHSSKSIGNILSHHERIWLQSCPSSFSPAPLSQIRGRHFHLFYTLSNADKPQKFLSFERQIPQYKINCRIPETQKFKTLRFLDCDVTIDQNNLSTSIYRRKKTFTCPGTDYNSFINSSFINNYVTTLNFLTNNGSPHTF